MVLEKLVKGNTTLLIPHENGYINFAGSLTYPTSYIETKRQILNAGLQIPSTNQMISLLYTSFIDKHARDLWAFEIVRRALIGYCERDDNYIAKSFRHHHYWLFQIFKYTKNGIFVIDDYQSKTINTNTQYLKKRLGGGTEIKGIKFSSDKEVVFIPRDLKYGPEYGSGSYSTKNNNSGNYSSNDFLKHPFILAMTKNEEGILKKLSALTNPEGHSQTGGGEIWGKQLPKENEPEILRVCSISMCEMFQIYGGDGRLEFSHPHIHCNEEKDIPKKNEKKIQGVYKVIRPGRSIGLIK